MALSQAYLEWEKEVELRGKQQVALNMLRGGIPVSQIAQFTGLSFQQIQQLQSELNNS